MQDTIALQGKTISNPNVHQKITIISAIAQEQGYIVASLGLQTIVAGQ